MNKIIISKIFLLFENAFVNNENNNNLQPSNMGKHNSSPRHISIPNLIALNKIEIILKKIEIIFEVNFEIENDDFFSSFSFLMDNLEELINYYNKKTSRLKVF